MALHSWTTRGASGMINLHRNTLVSPEASNRNPRIAATVSPELLKAINALAERKKWSTSKAAEFLLERGVQAEASSDSSNQDLDKLQKLLKTAKELGL